MNAGMNAYVWWYIRRFYGPIDDNSNVTKRGFVMSQYARFVRPGYYRVAATPDPQTYVQVTAYTNGSKLILVVLNVHYAAIDQVIKIKNGSVSMLTPYVTSETENCVQRGVIAVSNGSFTVTLEPESITTFISN
jgi:glucuronoarabinoxylan endo-1,4-beta-xylanase